ncbi:MAG: tRNA (guanosine(37)-N1)-methyltransferase TrmD [Mycoplasmataceae bacterium]|nr:tRNA (guanosine(37)-N1)-methyltransferase TrmD [Mycoplasmataceae bacterium]
MKITIITTFPKYFDEFKIHSIIKNAIEKKLVEITIIDLRDFATKGNVDDTVYGGGPGMLLLIEPLVKAIKKAKTKKTKVILLSPHGLTYNQTRAKKFQEDQNDLILVCGHYEGTDARLKYYIDEAISLGNFILTGGELGAMLIADSIIRLLPGVIKKESILEESFENNLLEYDHYSKPIDFEGHKVPDVLLSGNHQKIKKWRKQSAINNTIDLIVEEKKGN